MSAKALTDDETAVSPVVGVVLMVAITVLLAATAAVFVTGLGSDETGGTPTTAFDFEYSQSGSDELTIAHASGDTVEAGTLSVSIRGATYDGSTDDPNGQYDSTTFGSLGSGSEVTAGTSVTVEGSDLSGSGDLDLSDATVEVVWRSPDGEQSATLTTWLNE